MKQHINEESDQIRGTGTFTMPKVAPEVHETKPKPKNCGGECRCRHQTDPEGKTR